MSCRPPWATAKVRMYLAKCWYGMEKDRMYPSMLGVHWWDDYLLVACTWFHNWFVAPFFSYVGFPMKVLEIYEGFDAQAFAEGEW